MKRLIVLMLLFTTPAVAAPYLVCDPQAGVVDYQVDGASWVTARVPAEADGSIKLDVSPAPVGSTPLQVRACNQWACSEATPFDLARPSGLSTPAGVRLTH